MTSHCTHEHPLQKAVSGQGGNTICSGCEMRIASGKDYFTCRGCSFSLHRVCFNMPSSCQHLSEPGHDLLLVLAPSFQCKACGVQGSGFCYTCDICDTNYHSLCLKLPASEKCAQHPIHELQLKFSPPYNSKVGFKCDVCKGHGPNQWLYRCSICDYDVHLNCVYAAPNATTQTRNLPNNYNSASPSTGGQAMQLNLPSYNSSPFPMNNYNLSSPSTTSSFPGATYYTGDQIMPPSQLIMYQSQVAPALSTGTHMISLSDRAIPYNPAMSYQQPANGNFGTQMGSYGYAPVMSGQNGFTDMGVPSNAAYGVRSGNQPGGGLFGGAVATGILSGIGQGIGGGLINVVGDVFDGSDS